MDDKYNDLSEQNQTLSGKNKIMIPSKEALHALDNQRVHVIITQRKQNSWVNDLDERERLSKIQRVFH